MPIARLGYLLGGLLAVGFAVYELRGPHGVTAWWDKVRQIRELEAQNAELVRENQARREHIHKLANNAEEQELEIRRKLKLVRKDEQVYVLPDSKPAK